MSVTYYACDILSELLYSRVATKEVHSKIVKSAESVENNSPHSYARHNGGKPVFFPLSGLKDGWAAFRIPSKKDKNRTLAIFYYNMDTKTSSWRIK